MDAHKFIELGVGLLATAIFGLVKWVVNGLHRRIDRLETEEIEKIRDKQTEYGERIARIEGRLNGKAVGAGSGGC